MLFIAMFSANVYAAQHQLSIGGTPVTELPLRTFVQIFLIAAAAAIAVGKREPRAAVTMEECRAS